MAGTWPPNSRGGVMLQMLLQLPLGLVLPDWALCQSYWEAAAVVTRVDWQAPPANMCMHMRCRHGVLEGAQLNK